MDERVDAGKTNIGRALAAVALIFCVPVGVLFVSVATGALGVFLGFLGYVFGARRLGTTAIVLCTAAMLLGLAVGQGAMPRAYDAALDGVKESMRDPFADR